MDRYGRHKDLLSDHAWQLLCAVTCVVAGVGGLGSTVVSLLARLGPVKLELWDPGIVDEPDLNRQLLYGWPDVGRVKTQAAVRDVQRINPELRVTGHPEALTRDSYGQERAAVTGRAGTAAAELAPGPGPAAGAVGTGAARGSGPVVLFDCVDTLASRRELDRVCRDWALPVFHGAVQEWWGQAATLLPEGGGYDAIYGEEWEKTDAKEPGGQPIMPHVVTTIASTQVAEFVRWLEGPEHVSLSAHLWYYDGKRLSGTRLQLGGTSA